MTGTMLRIDWLNLRRDYVALVMVFVLPVVFFSIFAVIFSGMGGGGGGGAGSQSIRLIVVDQDQSEISVRFIDAISGMDGLNVVTTHGTTDGQPDPAPYSEEEAEKAVRSGDAPAAIILPAGFGATFGDFSRGGEAVRLIFDPANPFAQFSISGQLQAAAMTAAPDILMERGMGMLEQFGGGLTPGQQDAIDQVRPFLRGDKPWEELDPDDDAGGEGGGEGGEPPANTAETTGATGGNTGMAGLITVDPINVRALQGDDDSARDKPPNMVAYYAAGIGVMFLLFSMVGAAGSILEEEESGALERVLTSNVSMGALLLSKWMFFGLIGFLQVAVMFVWGEVVFGIDLWTVHHLAGFLAIAIPTAAAAAAFGIVLATICRSRNQLGGISTVVILIMSALGGSMVPRFAAPFLEKTSNYTFNGWALNGFLKVFWHDDPDHTLVQAMTNILPEIGVLVGLTAVFLYAARVIARRWETA